MRMDEAGKPVEQVEGGRNMRMRKRKLHYSFNMCTGNGASVNVCSAQCIVSLFVIIDSLCAYCGRDSKELLKGTTCH